MTAATSKPAGRGRMRWGIWGLALGYFSFYIPYSALTKAVSKGLLPGMEGPVSGFLLLPATVVATSLALPVFITLAGWWRHVPRRRVAGLALPLPRWQAACSGLATAVIIATTTLNYTFVGISIVFALLMMRGGVLVMGPLVDLLYRRRVHWYSWAALGLSLVALTVAFAEVGGYAMTAVAALNIGAYLLGYFFRLQFMTRLAKRERRTENLRFFVEETMVAAVLLTAVPAVLAVIGQGEIMLELRAGFTTVLGSGLALPGLLIGLLYAMLYQFGSRIYLDRRENTFCIPLNRCSSLLSGVVAAFVLAVLAGQAPPSGQQLVAALLLMAALLLLAYPAWRKRSQAALQQVFLFICSGNTSRSPMAQAICRAELAACLGLSPEALEAASIQVISAGLTATPGAPLASEAAEALRGLQMTLPAHTARPVTEDLVERATLIFCMTEAQRHAVATRFPAADRKLHRLDPDEDLGDPHGAGPEAHHALGQHVQRAIRRRLPELLGSEVAAP